MKQIFGIEARKQIKVGVDKSANIIKSTLGAKGKNVFIQEKGMPLIITKDGVTVAESINLENELERIGANLVKEASKKTAEEVGDGTTTSALLVQSLIEGAMNKMSSGADPILLKSGIQEGLKKALEVLESKEVKTLNQLRQVASISANEEELGNLIADIFWEIGKEGVITTEEHSGLGYKKEVVKGLEIDKGYASGYFINSAETLEATLNDPAIIVCDKRISVMSELIPLLQKVVETKKEILIIAEDFDDSVLGTLIANKVRGNFMSVAVKAPSFGSKKTDYLEDICALTGATLLSDSFSPLKDAQIESVGSAKKVIVKRDSTLIIGGAGNIEKRIKHIKAEIITCDLEYEKVDLRNRLAKLSGGVSVIKVGGATDKEIREKKFRVEDCIAATKAALEEGIVPGGGIALLNVKKKIKSLNLEGDERKGLEVFKDALEAPFMTILRNAGKNGGDYIKKFKNKKVGYDAREGKVQKDMIKSGIIDPYKVVKQCLLNSVSVANLFITAEGFIVEENEKHENLR